MVKGKASVLKYQVFQLVDKIIFRLLHHTDEDKVGYNPN